MKPEEFEKSIMPIIKKLEADGDPYFFTHFSKSRDRFSGFHEGLDKLDAVIIMKKLFEFFDMTEDDLQSFYLITKTAQP